jgi:hypothetical protein
MRITSAALLALALTVSACSKPAVQPDPLPPTEGGGAAVAAPPVAAPGPTSQPAAEPAAPSEPGGQPPRSAKITIAMDAQRQITIDGQPTEQGKLGAELQSRFTADLSEATVEFVAKSAGGGERKRSVRILLGQPDAVYVKDIETFCNAAAALDKDGVTDPAKKASELSKYLSQNLRSPRTASVFDLLEMLSPDERDEFMKLEAQKLGIKSCPMAESDKGAD